MINSIFSRLSLHSSRLFLNLLSSAKIMKIVSSSNSFVNFSLNVYSDTKRPSQSSGLLCLTSIPMNPITDFITVAYGTNDWGKTDYATFSENCPAFYAALAARHPSTPIFAFTPIPRGGEMTNTAFGHFSRAAELIRAVAASHENITVIEGEDLFPYDVSLYSDGFLHPNDEGFAIYAENLIRKIRAELG